MMKYRPDIDGLRTVAVLPVVFYHADMISGGFVGVDVFFVISGFLITKILFEEAVYGKLSIVKFYDRRIRRIIPALFTVFAVSIPLAILLLTANDLMAFGRSMVAATAFVSNIYFWSSHDYFSIESDPAPLIHTWSLAVEEQFYIFFPIFILLLVRFRRLAWLAPVIVILTVISFLGSWYGSTQVPRLTFYMLPTRAWEMFVGCLIAIPFLPAATPIVGRLLASAGIAAIAVACFWYSSSTVFPGLAAALPVAGAAFIIYGGMYSGGGVVYRALSLPPMIYIGKISYSLYLWHWPLFIFAEQYFDRRPDAVEYLGLIALSFAAASLSYHFVESPFRKGGVFPVRWTRFAATGGGMAAFISVGWLLLFSSGLPGRMPEQALIAAAARNDTDPKVNGCLLRVGFLQQNTELQRNEGCIFGEGADDRYRAVLWGDSHGAAFLPGVADSLGARGQRSRQLTQMGCPPLLGAVGVTPRQRGRGDRCAAFNAAVMEELTKAKGLDTVIIAGRWSAWQGNGMFGAPPNFLVDDINEDLSSQNSMRAFEVGLNRTIAAVQKLGVHVVVIGPVPEFPQPVPDCVMRRSFHGSDTEDCYRLDASDGERLLGPIIASLRRLEARWPDVTFLFPTDELCTSEGCDARLDGRIAYRDDNHINQTAAKSLFARLFSRIDHIGAGKPND